MAEGWMIGWSGSFVFIFSQAIKSGSQPVVFGQGLLHGRGRFCVLGSVL